MTSTPTPVEFLGQPSDPDEDDYQVTPGYRLAGRPEDPYEELEQTDLAPHLASIAASLRELAGATAQQVTAPSSGGGLADLYAEVTAERDDLEALHDAKQSLIEQVLEVCKPSTSKLADKVRAVLEPVVEPPKAEPSAGGEVGDAQPTADADVEEWRGYARSKGYQGPDVDTANRSQIRTMLGIDHEATS